MSSSSAMIKRGAVLAQSSEGGGDKKVKKGHIKRSGHNVNLKFSTFAMETAPQILLLVQFRLQKQLPPFALFCCVGLIEKKVPTVLFFLSPRVGI